MSLEGAMEEERRLISQILERQQLNATSRTGRRDRGISSSTSRALSRSLSRSSSWNDDDTFLITSKDPSSRLRAGNKSTDKKDDDESEDETDNDSGEDDDDNDEDYSEVEQVLGTISSEEEQISDTDTEFEYDDDADVLPNYSTYNALIAASPSGSRSVSPLGLRTKVNSDRSNSSSTGPSSINTNKPVSHVFASPTLTPKISSRDEITQIHNRKLVKDATQAEKLDEVLAAERAAANARAIGRDVPSQFMDDVQKTAEQAGTKIHVDPEGFYKNNQGRRERLQEYAKYKKRLTMSADSRDGFIVPYTADFEEKIDSELARVLNENIKISDIQSFPKTQRTIRTITRGNFFEILTKTDAKNPKTFVLCMDFSEESKNALEWCVGTVLVDGCILYVLNVIEDDQYSSMHLNGIKPKNKTKKYGSGRSSRSGSTVTTNPTIREHIREDNVKHITREVLSLLRLTKLQVHVVIQSSHHPIPRHFITCVIKHISPTMVIVGSKGKLALNGVLLGSLSNYLVRKSTAPVMVVKHKLKKLTKKGKQMNNNVGTLHSLAEARVD